MSHSPLTSVPLPWLEPPLTEWEYLDGLIKEHGSPINLLNTKCFEENVVALQAALGKHLTNYAIHFAMKANKCLCFPDAALQSGIGVDVASLHEMKIAESLGVPGSEITITGAVKSQTLIEEGMKAKALIVADSEDEVREIEKLSEEFPQKLRLALRIAGFDHDGGTIPSRFGILRNQIVPLAMDLITNSPDVVIEGLHFHLSGYLPATRHSALKQTIMLAKQINAAGGCIASIDVGGGFPVRYLESKSEWENFWELNEFENLIPFKRSESYPYFNELSMEAFFDEMLEDLAEELKNLTLRCEPGRALLSRCGATVARIATVKPATHGRTAITCEINGTQLRPSKGEFLVDPILVTQETNGPFSTKPEEKYHCYGRYCSENDFLFRRPIAFPEEPKRGDILIFPNTAGYHMHFLETHGHGFPLSSNIVIDDPESPIPDMTLPLAKN